MPHRIVSGVGGARRDPTDIRRRPYSVTQVEPLRRNVSGVAVDRSPAEPMKPKVNVSPCLLYTSDAADD